MGKPPRRPAKKKINQETPGAAPPEHAAPEQLPPHSAWAWSETRTTLY